MIDGKNNIYVIIFSILLAIIISSGFVQASEWRMFRANAQHSGSVMDYVPPPFEISWDSAISGNINSPPVYMDETLYIGSTDGFLYSLNASDGKIKWKAKTSGSIYSSPAIGDGLIFVTSDDTYLYAFDTAGNKKWSFKTGNIIRSSPVFKDGSVYFGSDDGSLYVLEARSGKLKWKKELKEPVEERVRASPAMGANDIIYIPANFRLYAIQNNGSKKLAPNVGFTASLPAMINENRIYIVSQEDGRYGNYYLKGLNIETGNLESSIGLSEVPPQPLLSVNNNVYMAHDEKLYRVENKRLVQLFSRNDVFTAPVASKDMIHVGSQNGYLYTIDLSGNLISKKQISNRELTVGVIANNKLYAVSANGHVYGLTSATLTVEDVLASAEKSIEHAANICADITKVNIILQRAMNRLNESDFDEAISTAKEAENTAKAYEIECVDRAISDSEAHLNEMRNSRFDLSHLDNLLQDSKELFSRNETQEAYKKAKVVEMFPEKVLPINSKIISIDNLHGNISVYDDRISAVNEDLNNNNFDGAIEKIDSLGVELGKDIDGWGRTYNFLIYLLLLIVIMFLIMKKIYL